ncbi:MAG: hypothetical protein RLN88_15230 [Ekhidna sp.]
MDDLIQFMRRWKLRNPEKKLTLNTLAVHGLGQSHEDFLTDLIYLSNKVNSKQWSDLGINSIIYNEYLRSHESNSFSWSLKKLEAFEKYGVEYAARACWGTCQNGSLDGILIEDANGGYNTTENWFGYAVYSLMTGKRHITKNDSDLATISAEREDGSKIILIANPQIGPEVHLTLKLPSSSVNSWNIYQITDDGIKLVSSKSTNNISISIAKRESYLVSEKSISDFRE